MINVTQACLRNFSFTYEAWMAMPDFILPKKGETGGLNTKKAFVDSQISRNTIRIGIDSNSSYSINSEEDDQARLH